jgi:hypothetical protein
MLMGVDLIASLKNVFNDPQTFFGLNLNNP